MNDKQDVRYHCVSQLREDSWVYRLKRDGEPLSEDDLVSVEDYLAMHDRLVTERDTLDKKRINEIGALRDQIVALNTKLDVYKQSSDRAANVIQELHRQVHALEAELEMQA